MLRTCTQNKVENSPIISFGGIPNELDRVVLDVSHTEISDSDSR